MNHWPVVRLGEICCPKQHPTISLNALRSKGYPVYGANGQIGFYDSYTHHKTTIAITCRGATCGTVNVVPPFSYITGNAMALDDLDDRRVDLSYLVAALRWRGLRDVISGSAQPQITRKPLLDVQVQLPSLDEQRQIVGILDKADNLRQKRRKALECLRTLLEAMFEAMCTPMSPRISIGSALDHEFLLLHKDGNHGSLYPRAEDFGDDGVPFLSAKSISEDGYIEDRLTERLSETKAASLRHGWVMPGDVLLAHNATVGKVGLYRGGYDRAIVGTSLTIFRPNPEKIFPEVLFSALRARDFQAQLTKNMGQTTRNQVPITAQRSLDFPVPDIEKQRSFVQKVKNIDTIRKCGCSHLAKLEALFASLQYRAFRGELTLASVAPAKAEFELVG